MEDVRTAKEWISKEKKKTDIHKQICSVCDDNAFP